MLEHYDYAVVTYAIDKTLSIDKTQRIKDGDALKSERPFVGMKLIGSTWRNYAFTFIGKEKTSIGYKYAWIADPC